MKVRRIFRPPLWSPKIEDLWGFWHSSVGYLFGAASLIFGLPLAVLDRLFGIRLSGRMMIASLVFICAGVVVYLLDAVIQSVRKWIELLKK